jgi:hypothetical protein
MYRLDQAGVGGRDYISGFELAASARRRLARGAFGFIGTVQIVARTFEKCRRSG